MANCPFRRLCPPIWPRASRPLRRGSTRLTPPSWPATAGRRRRERKPARVIGGPIVTELRAVWAEIEALSPEAAEYVALRRGDRPTWAGLARLAAALPAGAALLSLFDTGERTLVFLLPGGADAPVVHAMDLSDTEAGATHGEVLFRVFIDAYSDEMLNRATWRELGRPLTQRWRELGRTLLGPLRPHLAGINQLIIAPEGPYHQLPLHALWLSEDGDTLLDHCAVSYVPALGVLERLLRRAPAAGGGSAVFGYTHADPTTADGRRERKVFLGEAQAVAGLVGVAPVLDAAATGTALRAATANPLRLLHLSCHGYFHPGDTLASGVQLAGENGGRAVYTARDFMAQRLPADLVTLSACQTGISGSLGGDEMAGLSLALLSAGARSLLLGLWSVNAVTTAVMMMDFYRRLWPGDGSAPPTKAEALRQTMLAMRRGQLVPPQPGFDPTDPYYWAPFALVGDWR